MSLLEVKNLQIRFSTPDGTVTGVNDLNFSLQTGETLGLVGESGSGKTQTAFALMGLLANNGKASGEALFEGQNLLHLSEPQLNQIRSQQIAMIFQDFMTSLNPPDLLNLPEGCSFQDRCLQAIDQCRLYRPALKTFGQVGKRPVSGILVGEPLKSPS